MTEEEKKEKTKEQGRKYYKNNLEKIKEYIRKNRKKMNKYAKKYYHLKNPQAKCKKKIDPKIRKEKNRNYQKKYFQLNKEKIYKRRMKNWTY